MKPDIWMPMYWADFLADTLHLNRSEIGSYALLIGAYWRRGEALPDDDEALRNVCRCNTQEWMRCKGTMASFFQVGAGVWRHKRIDAEIELATENKAAQIARTAAATAARLGKNVTSNVTSDVTSNVTFTPTPSPTPYLEKEIAPGFGIGKLRLAINRLYQREQNSSWTYAEEYALAEVAKRASVESELSEIETFQSKLSTPDLKYFPQSVSGLLTKWTDTLDRARLKQTKKTITATTLPALKVEKPMDREKAAEQLRKMKGQAI